jgi:predicted component of type VI protein secretion system
MQVKLVVARGARQKQTIALRSAETVIGRRRGCDVRISSSQVSRRHCLLSLHAGSVTVEDLDSVNGTYVNGERISGKRMVRPGDRLEVGPVCFVVEYPTLDAAAVQGPGAALAPGAELEVLPAVEEGAAPFAFHEAEALDELELVEEDTEQAPQKPKRAQPAAREEPEEPLEALPVDEEEGPLAAEHDARNVFSELDRPRPGTQPRRSP